MQDARIRRTTVTVAVRADMQAVAPQDHLFTVAEAKDKDPTIIQIVHQKVDQVQAAAAASAIFNENLQFRGVVPVFV